MSCHKRTIISESESESESEINMANKMITFKKRKQKMELTMIGKLDIRRDRVL